MKIKKFEELLRKIDNPMVSTVFANIHGEKFTVYYDGMTCYFGGDETDQEVIKLFNLEFDIWGSDELKKLGEAMIELAKMKEAK